MMTHNDMHIIMMISMQYDAVHVWTVHRKCSGGGFAFEYTSLPKGLLGPLIAIDSLILLHEVVHVD